MSFLRIRTFRLAGGLRAALVGFGILACCGLAEAQEVFDDAPLMLSARVKLRLAAIQDAWFEWDQAFLRDDPGAASEAVSELRTALTALGMRQLPEIRQAMLSRASEARISGDLERCEWAIAMAGDVDPGSAAVDFARADLQRARGENLIALRTRFAGLFLAAGDSSARALLRANLVLLGVSALLLAAGFYLALLMVLHGSRLIEDLGEIFERVVPAALAYPLTLLLTIWPVFVPELWRWLPIYWFIVLWRYLGTSQRQVSVGLIVAALGSSWLLTAQNQRLEVDLGAPMRGVEHLRSGDLYGALFSDVAELVKELPDSAAAAQVAGDLHLGLGQPDVARLQYQQVLGDEPHNAAVHNDLGGYYSSRRQFGDAIEHLETSVTLEPRWVEPLFNLYKVYQENLEIDEAVRMLTRARDLDETRVNSFLQEDPEFVTAPERGVSRSGEIRDELLRVQRRRPSDSSVPGSVARVYWIAVLGIAGIVAYLLRRLSGLDSARRRLTTSSLWRLLTLALPGLGSLAEGAGLRALLALVLPAVAVVLMTASRWAYPLPWIAGVEGGGALLGIVLLLLSYGVRLAMRLRGAKT